MIDRADSFFFPRLRATPTSAGIIIRAIPFYGARLRDVAVLSRATSSPRRESRVFAERIIA